MLSTTLMLDLNFHFKKKFFLNLKLKTGTIMTDNQIYNLFIQAVQISGLILVSLVFNRRLEPCIKLQPISTLEITGRQLLSVFYCLIQPIRMRQKRLQTEPLVLGADQKERGLWIRVSQLKERGFFFYFKCINSKCLVEGVHRFCLFLIRQKV